MIAPPFSGLARLNAPTSVRIQRPPKAVKRKEKGGKFAKRSDNIHTPTVIRSQKRLQMQAF